MCAAISANLGGSIGQLPSSARSTIMCCCAARPTLMTGAALRCRYGLAISCCSRPDGPITCMTEVGGRPSRQPKPSIGPISVVTNGAGQPETDLLCGRFRIPMLSQQLLLNHLPGRLVVHSVQGEASEDSPRAGIGRRLAPRPPDRIDARGSAGAGSRQRGDAEPLVRGAVRPDAASGKPRCRRPSGPAALCRAAGIFSPP